MYIVATPIGNLEDLSFRALKILKKVDFIICEDTRVTNNLLTRYKIKKNLISYHQHSKLRKIDFIIAKLKKGQSAALISDAGTPGIVDPGQILIKKAMTSKIQVIPIPGAQAGAAALSASGFATDQFLFLGFLPKKKGRQTLLKKLADFDLTQTIVLYESPYRIIKTLQDLKSVLDDCEIVVARELTKKFETIYRGRISEIIPQIKEKGEFVIVVKIKD